MFGKKILAAIATLTFSSFVGACSSTFYRQEGSVNSSKSRDSIGSATMNADESINLMLRAEGPGGVVGDSLQKFEKSDKDYEMILRHLGGLKPGESKPVPPWPEK